MYRRREIQSSLLYCQYQPFLLSRKWGCRKTQKGSILKHYNGLVGERPANSRAWWVDILNLSHYEIRSCTSHGSYTILWPPFWHQSHDFRDSWISHLFKGVKEQLNQGKGVNIEKNRLCGCHLLPHHPNIDGNLKHKRVLVHKKLDQEQIWSRTNSALLLSIHLWNVLQPYFIKFASLHKTLK